ncbi:MAG: glycosyltransferase [Chloroflexaceae bacterium]|jgi:UDP:flavonoid glycosyltransferase YjiC (YdhE family)|nr:glycosyltransferase [Chloroflexaceae bacterium]
MNLTILALGSRGDVQPFVALGRALARRGVPLTIATTTDYEALVRGHGLAFAPIVGRISQLMDVELVYAALDAARQPLPLGFARRFVQHVAALLPAIVADCRAAAAQADGLLVSSLGLYPGALLAEAMGLPLLLAHFHPFSATASMPDVSFPALPRWLPLQGSYNRLTHRLARHGLWQLLRGPINQVRRDMLGLPTLAPVAMWQWVERLRPPTLYGYSSLLLPRPPDWDEHHTVTGYWFLDDAPGWTPPAALEAFLAAGPPPVYLSFGSILAGRNPDDVSRLLLNALAATRQRGLISSAWGDLGNISLPPTVLRVESLPHAWLFRRVSAVVTHGGAGTVAAALRAGLPLVVVPFFGDQRLWGERVSALGFGPLPISRAELSAERLAAALNQALHDRGMRARAQALGAQLTAENGAERAAEVVQGWLAHG